MGLEVPSLMREAFHTEPLTGAHFCRPNSKL